MNLIEDDSETTDFTTLIIAIKKAKPNSLIVNSIIECFILKIESFYVGF